MSFKLDKDKLGFKALFIFGFLFFMSIAFIISENLFIKGNIQISTLFLVLFFVGFGLFSLFPFLNFNKQYNQYKEISTKPKSANTPIWLKVLGVFFFSAILILTNYIGIIRDPSSGVLIPAEMISVKGTLMEDVAYNPSGKGSYSLQFKVNEYPSITFDIGFAKDHSFITDYLSKDSKVEILIIKQKYNTWVVKSKQKTFLDKHDTPRFISVFGLKDSEYIYFDLNDYNKLIKKDNEIGFYIAIVFDLIALFIILTYLYKKKTNAKTTL